jgi:Uma2 family endonuclease
MAMVTALSWRKPPLTKAQANLLFMLTLEDDTEDSPWMVMGDLQFWSASGFAHSLRTYGHEMGLGWYVGSMLPIQFIYPGTYRKRTLAPDVMVAFTPEKRHTSYDVQVEGAFPPFVLEVVSPSSVERDEEEKLEAYTLLGVREYALFTPKENAPSTLMGYRREEGDDKDAPMRTWEPDAGGRLWSALLGLHLEVHGQALHARTADGRLLLMPEEEALARARAELAQQRAEEALARAEAERARAEADRARAEEERAHAEAEQRRSADEVERLRRELERYQQEGERSP